MEKLGFMRGVVHLIIILKREGPNTMTMSHNDVSSPVLPTLTVHMEDDQVFAFKLTFSDVQLGWLCLGLGVIISTGDIINMKVSDTFRTKANAGRGGSFEWFYCKVKTRLHKE